MYRERCEAVAAGIALMGLVVVAVVVVCLTIRALAP